MLLVNIVIVDIVNQFTMVDIPIVLVLHHLIALSENIVIVVLVNQVLMEVIHIVL